MNLIGPRRRQLGISADVAAMRPDSAMLLGDESRHPARRCPSLIERRQRAHRIGSDPR
jgi:hypothetical protein